MTNIAAVILMPLVCLYEEEGLWLTLYSMALGTTGLGLLSFVIFELCTKGFSL